jgi:hypothetical protein
VDAVLVALALSPLWAVIVLLWLNLRREWHQLSARPLIEPYYGASDGDVPPDDDDAPPTAGVREPRRPLVPASGGGVALAIPDEPVADSPATSAPRFEGSPDVRQHRLAS